MADMASRSSRAWRERTPFTGLVAVETRWLSSATTSQLLLVVTVIIMQRPNATVHRGEASKADQGRRTEELKGKKRRTFQGAEAQKEQREARWWRRWHAKEAS